jgi:hypothetical protein
VCEGVVVWVCEEVFEGVERCEEVEVKNCEEVEVKGCEEVEEGVEMRRSEEVGVRDEDVDV